MIRFSGLYITIFTIVVLLCTSAAESATSTISVSSSTPISDSQSSNPEESTNYTSVAAPGAAAILIAAACGFCITSRRKRVPIAINNPKQFADPTIKSQSNQMLIHVPLQRPIHGSSQMGQNMGGGYAQQTSNNHRQISNVAPQESRSRSPAESSYSQGQIIKSSDTERGDGRLSIPTSTGSKSDGKIFFASSTSSNATEKEQTDEKTFSGTTTGAIALPGYLCLNWGVDFEVDQKKINAGGLGTIFNATIISQEVIKNIGLSQVVAKIMKIPEKASSDDIQRTFRFEVAVMNSLRKSPYIVKLVGYCEVPELTILMKKYEMSATDFIKKTLQNSDSYFYKNDVKISIKIGHDISKGMSTLHSYGILHLDLKPQNVLLDFLGKGPENFECVICDFGFTRVIGDKLIRTGLEMPEESGCTPKYTAPEVFAAAMRKPNPNETKTYTEIDKKIDVYAYAVSMYEILAKTPAWVGLKWPEIRDNVMKSKRPEFPPKTQANFGSKWIDIMTKCWAQRPEDRPTFDKIAHETAALLKASK